MPQDRRLYTRYQISVEAKTGLQSGIVLPAQALDISIEGVRLRVEGIPPFKVNDELFIVIKANQTIKLKGKIKWIKFEKGYTDIGVKFDQLDIQTSQHLSKILSEMALSDLEDKYLI